MRFLILLIEFLTTPQITLFTFLSPFYSIYATTPWNINNDIPVGQVRFLQVLRISPFLPYKAGNKWKALVIKPFLV